LEGPVEGGHGLLDQQTAAVDAPGDAAFAEEARRLSEEALESVEVAGVLLLGPSAGGVDVAVSQAEAFEVLLEPLPEVGGGGWAAEGVGSLGHDASPGVEGATPRHGRASYSARSRGSV